MADYANTLSKVLQKSTDLLNDDDISTSNISADTFNKITFPEPLINYEMSPHFNPKTEFYYFLIRMKVHDLSIDFILKYNLRKLIQVPG